MRDKTSNPLRSHKLRDACKGVSEDGEDSKTPREDLSGVCHHQVCPGYSSVYAQYIWVYLVICRAVRSSVI